MVQVPSEYAVIVCRTTEAARRPCSAPSLASRSKWKVNTMRIRSALSVIFLAALPVSLYVRCPVTSVLAANKLTEINSPCSRKSLTIKEGETDAAMGGVRQTPYIFTNSSSSPCTLQGYPSVELLNRQGAVARRSTKQKSDDPIDIVTIQPGKSAWFNLNYNSGGAGYMGKPCPTYPKVRITAPGIAAAFVLRSEITSCRGTSIEVTSIRSGLPD